MLLRLSRTTLDGSWVKIWESSKISNLSKNVNMSRSLCMHKIRVHAQKSCACTRVLCMHKHLVHAPESCACTRISCVYTILVQTQYTLVLLHHNEYCSEEFPYQTWDVLIHLHLHSRLRRIQWRIVKNCNKHVYICNVVNYKL